MRAIVRLALLVALAGACSNAPSNGQEGAPCVRLAQCASGLACVEGMCTTDLTALAEAGLVPVLDAGAPMDGATADVAMPDGSVPDDDAGN